MQVGPSLLAPSLLLLLSNGPTVPSSGAPAQSPALAAAQCRSGRLSVPDPANLPLAAAGSGNLAIIYAIPSDVAYEEAVHQRLVESAHDVRAWYQCATGSPTWEFAFPEIVRVYHGLQTRAYYLDHGDWWGSLLGEMGESGQPIWSPGTVTALWARGAGWWAGAAQGCLGECGIALLGVELFPEFNVPEWSGGECPAASGPAAWPCTPLGALAHELGHTVGLPHPLDVPGTSADAFHSLMQTHWNYPDFATGPEAPWGLLTLERQALYPSPFMLSGIDLIQPHDCDLVNLPVTGAAPAATFELSQDGLTIDATSTSQDAVLNYWTFGDGHISDAASVTHTYDAPGDYTVVLRTTAANAMMAEARTDLALDLCAPLSARLTTFPAKGTLPARFRLQASITVPEGEAIDPAREAVVVRIGDLVLEIPAGSFTGGAGRWLFSGSLGGVTLSSVIQSRGASRYALTLEARGAAVSTTDPVGVTIGARSWCTTS